MKHIAFLFIMLCLLMTPSAMAWESAVHAKGVQDICKAFGFSEAAAIRVGDGAWYDGNDIRLDRKEGEKGVSAFRNQDRVFNTGVLAEGTPVKTYGKFSISPNDTRYLNSRKYLNKAISLMKEENPGEALYDLGVGVRALQNIFANRDVVNDAAWTARGKMENGASAWMPGMAFDAAWHNVDDDDDVFSAAHSDALKASLQATMDYVDEFLKACPKAVKNVRQPSASTVDGIVAETVSLIPLREKLAQKVKQTNGDIVRQLDKALVTFHIAAMAKAKERKTQPPYALTIHPARRLATIAKVSFRRKLEDMKIDAEEFSGSADAEWKAFEKKTTDLLEALLKVSDDLSKTMMEASAALKKASQEEGYMVARKHLSELSRAFFLSLKPYCEYETFFDEQITYWVDVLNSQMEEYAHRYGAALLKNYSALKTKLPKAETAFADFMTASNAALKEYMDCCDNALVDFGQEMSAIAEAYGKNADALKKSAAECVSAARAVFSEKAKQTAGMLKEIAPLKQGEAIPKAVDDAIRGMMKDAYELKNNVFENIAPTVSDSRRFDSDPQKALRLLAAHATRQDFLRPIDIGSRRPASWTPAVWNSDAPLKITYVKRTPKPGSSKFDFDLPDSISTTNDAKSTAAKGDQIFQTPAKSAEATKDGTTQETTNKVAGDVAGATLGMAAEKALTPVGGAIGEAIGSVRPGGGQVGKKIGEKAGEVASKVIQRTIEKEGGEYIVKQLDDKFGEGATEAAANDLIKFSEGYTEARKEMEPIVNTATDVMALVNPAVGTLKLGEKLDSIVGYFHDKYILNPLIDMSLDAIFGENESDSKKETDNLNEDLDFLMNTLNPPTLMDGMTKYIENTMDELNDKFDMDLPVSREIGMQWLDHKLSPIKDFTSGIMDTISSFTLQIRGFMMGIINLAVDLEHIDISDKMNQSLQTLKSDLETMMGKDDQQDKSVKRKATIENKGRDLKRTSTKGSDLKGAPSVKQIEMKSN